MLFDFLIPRRPLSVQAKRKKNLQRWKAYVRAEAAKRWSRDTLTEGSAHLKLFYLCNDDPVDADNIIKPIQDALSGLIYEDDVLVTDVECHRRRLSETHNITDYPELLLDGLNSSNECVYVQVFRAGPLEDHF